MAGTMCGSSNKSQNWWRGFKRRHPEVTSKAPKGLEHTRAKQGDPAILNDFFEKLASIVEEHGISASTIWNADEKPFNPDPLPRRVVAKKGSRPSQQHKRSHDHITVIVCVNAAGQCLPPQIIFSRKQLRRDLLTDGPADALYSTQDKGGMDAELFGEWFDKIFLAQTSRTNAQVCVS